MPSDQSGGGNRRALEDSDILEELADSKLNVRPLQSTYLLVHEGWILLLLFYHHNFTEKEGFVLQAKQVGCPFTHTWNTILGRMEKITQIDNLVNCGVALMFPIVALSSWLSHWR